jgi:hypothetical protein
MSIEVTSTKAKVRDPQKIQEILDSYEVCGVGIKLQEEKDEWVLEMAFEDKDDESLDWWPSPAALHLDQLPMDEEYPEEDDLFDEWDKRLGDQGDEGFLALLRDLATVIQTPLLILSANRDEEGSSAKVWSLQPGTKEVETLIIDFDG